MGGRRAGSPQCHLRPAPTEGKELFKRLAATADVLCENFRPGTMEKWGLGPDDLPPALVYVRISVFGQSGPYAPRPGLDRLGIAFGGLLHLTGDPDRPPVRPGVTVSDYLTGVFAAFAAVSTLYGQQGTSVTARNWARSSTRRSMAPCCAFSSGPWPATTAWASSASGRGTGCHTRPRWTTTPPLTASSCASSPGQMPTSPGCAEPWANPTWPEILASPPWPNGQPEVTRSTGWSPSWTASLSAQDITARCVEFDVPIGTAYSAADIFADPHMAERGDLVAVDDPVIGPVRQQAPFPRLSRHPTPVPTGAPRLGEHNHEVWCDLVGLSNDELRDLTARGVV